MTNNYYDVLHITENHTGKMKGKSSLSSSPLVNEQCKRNCLKPNWVCSKCYSIRMMKMYKTLEAVLRKNYFLLTQEILPFETLPIINKLDFRLEAFGDLANENHVINFFNICNKNTRTIFAIWTKNPHLIDAVLKAGYKKPENLIIIYSNPILNTTITLKTVHEKMGYYFIDKTFNVYDKHYLKEHPAIVPNCGSRSCENCNLCYTFNDVTEIIEILK